MPVKKKTTAAKKAPAKKAKAAPKKKTTTTSKAKNTKPVGPREQKLASTALKLVDEAAALLRKGIRESANTSEKTRLATKQKAHNLLTKATGSLSDALSEGASALHKVIGRL